jgi:hypothetical protein
MRKSHIEEDLLMAQPDYTRRDVIIHYKKYYPNRKIVSIKPYSKTYLIKYIES